MSTDPKTAWPQLGDPVLYDNPHTGKQESGWVYQGPSWKPGRINLAKPGTSPQITAQLVDPARVEAHP